MILGLETYENAFDNFLDSLNRIPEDIKDQKLPVIIKKLKECDQEVAKVILSYIHGNKTYDSSFNFDFIDGIKIDLTNYDSIDNTLQALINSSDINIQNYFDILQYKNYQLLIKCPNEDKEKISNLLDKINKKALKNSLLKELIDVQNWKEYLKTNDLFDFND